MKSIKAYCETGYELVLGQVGGAFVVREVKKKKESTTSPILDLNVALAIFDVKLSHEKSKN